MKWLAVPILPLALVLASCASAPPVPAANWVRPGRVEVVYETVRRTEGNPAGGAVAGAIIGGIIGGDIGGHAHRGHYHRNPIGALVGAATGAAIGVNASQGVTEDRTYEVVVRFDDGAYEAFVFRGLVPFRTGDPVVLTPQGLAPAQAPAMAPPQFPPPPPEQLPPPP